MNDLPEKCRIGRARLLRRSGATYDEIRAVVGPVSDDRLIRWLKGIPRPAETYRSRAKDDLRRECRRLRAQGLTYDEIAAKTGAGRGSLSLWLHDMPQRSPDAEEHRLQALRASLAIRRRARLAARDRRISDAARSIGSLSERELLLVGVALYWAEGAKSKPWAIRDRITFINSDPTAIQVFLAWLRAVGVDPRDCGYRVMIHVTADVRGAEIFWAALVGVPPSQFSRTTLKRHNPKTVRHNTGDEYRGCLVVDVRRSAQLYQSVAGWWSGIQRAAASTQTAVHTGAVSPPWGNWQSRRPLEP